MMIPEAKAVSEMSEGLSTVPEATYNLKVHKADYVAVPKGKDAKGPYIKAQLIITGPSTPETEQYIGRYVFMNYSLTGEGSFRVRELLTVTGHGSDFVLDDDSKLVGLEFAGSVVIEAGKDGYADKNQVKRHMPVI